MSRKSVIIVAGGKGLRMGSQLPKQFIPIAGKPVLMHTIENFYNYDNDIHIVLVLPLTHQDYWKDLCKEYNFTIKHTIAIGGDIRFHSVKNGLEHVKEGIVAVQDGVRPSGSREMIARCFDAMDKHQAAIPVVGSTDSLRIMLDDGNSQIIDRSKIRLIQTPQVFHTDVLKKAYETEYRSSFTDDASVVEATGVKIHLVEGEVTNIKITTILDLKIGEIIIEGLSIKSK